MYSGHPAELCLAKSRVIAWARCGAMFQVRETLSNPMDLDPANVEQHWQTLIRAEETARVVLALRLHDFLLASTFHHEPLLRHDPSRLPSCFSEQAFSQPSAQRWLASATQPPTATPSRFHAYATLAAILAHIQNQPARPLIPDLIADIHARLLAWVLLDDNVDAA